MWDLAAMDSLANRRFVFSDSGGPGGAQEVAMDMSCSRPLRGGLHDRSRAALGGRHEDKVSASTLSGQTRSTFSQDGLPGFAIRPMKDLDEGWLLSFQKGL